MNLNKFFLYTSESDIMKEYHRESLRIKAIDIIINNIEIISYIVVIVFLSLLLLISVTIAYHNKYLLIKIKKWLMVLLIDVMNFYLVLL